MRRCRVYLAVVVLLFAAITVMVGRAAVAVAAYDRDLLPAQRQLVSALALTDRDNDGRANEPKPEPEREAAIGLIARIRPDILAIQEMGSPVSF